MLHECDHSKHFGLVRLRRPWICRSHGKRVFAASLGFLWHVVNLLRLLLWTTVAADAAQREQTSSLIAGWNKQPEQQKVKRERQREKESVRHA